MLLQTFIVWAALSGAVFSFSVHASENVPVVVQVENVPSVDWFRVEILRGSQVKPHVIPGWFARRVDPEPVYVAPVDSFVFQPPSVSSMMGRGQKMGPQNACRRSDGTWLWCN